MLPADGRSTELVPSGGVCPVPSVTASTSTCLCRPLTQPCSGVTASAEPTPLPADTTGNVNWSLQSPRGAGRPTPLSQHVWLDGTWRSPQSTPLTFGALTASATTWGALTSFLAESLKEERQVRVVPSRSGKPKATINILMLDRTTHHLLSQTGSCWSATSQTRKG